MQRANAPAARRLPEWLLRLSLVACALAITVAALELGTRAWVRWTRPAVHRPWPGDASPPAVGDDVVGWVLPPNAASRAVKHAPDGSLCYDVTYRADAHGRRTVGQRYDPARPHLVLFGCSFTMGEGLDDADTLAAQLDARIPDYNIYNYAVHGYGPQQMLARLQAHTLASTVESDHGIALFVLLPSHVSRVIGDTRAVWVYSAPYYYLDRAGALIHDGSFWTGRRYTTALYRAITVLKGYSSFFATFKVNLPLQLHGELYVVFHPSWALDDPGDRRLFEVIRRHLAAAAVPMLDYSRDRQMDDSEVIDPGCDRHPNGHMNAQLADWIARDLPRPSAGPN